MPSSPGGESRSANEAPVTDESVVVDLPIRGTVPRSLSGRYLRIGEGLVHAVGLAGGRAPSYSCRSIPADATNVVSFGSSMLAFADGALAYEIGPGLDAVRRVDLAGARRSLTAHPRIDPVTGELHLVTFAPSPSQLHVTVSPGGLTRTIRSIENAPSGIRQLEVAGDEVVFLADGYVGVAGRTGVDAKAAWFAIDTDARNIAAAETRAESVLVYTIGPSLERRTLRRGAKTVDREVLDAGPCALATSNPRPPHGVHRFLWTAGAGSVHKHDLETGSGRSHELGGGRDSSTLTFVADPDRSGDADGGWLVGFAHDEAGNEADFVVLDAQAVERPAVAVMRLPRRMPARGHGTWVPAPQI